MPAHDGSHYRPPAPTASVVLRNPAEGTRVLDVLLLVDTGADITVLPRRAVEQLAVALLDQRYELTGFDGSKSFAPCVTLDLLFLGRAFRGRYLLIDADHGLLGRDVLTHAVLLLDGPRQQWSEHTP